MENKENNKKITIIYHADADGRMGAAIAKMYYLEKEIKEENLEFIETNHGKLIEFKKFYDTLVIIDFSFNKEIMDKLNKITKHFIWIDHHITAKNENFELWKDCKGLRNIENSGTMLAWKYYTIDFDLSIPYAVRLVEDYDLWQFEYGEDTKHFAEINNVWEMDEFYNLLNFKDELYNKLKEGKLLYQRKEFNIENRVKPENNNIKIIYFECYKTALINNTQTQDGSLLGNEICKTGYDIALKYSIKNNRIIFGLNSIGEVDVAKIAKKFSGGGHKNAAGFNMDLTTGFNFLIELYKGNN